MRLFLLILSFMALSIPHSLFSARGARGFCKIDESQSTPRFVIGEPNPYADINLHPAKDPTVWLAETDSGTTLKVTLSHVALPEDCRHVAHGLETYEYQHTGKRPPTTFLYALGESPEETLPFGQFFQESGLLHLEEAFSVMRLEEMHALLTSAEATLHERGIRRLYVTIEEQRDPPAIPFGGHLEARGYTRMGTILNLETGALEEHFYRELPTAKIEASAESLRLAFAVAPQENEDLELLGRCGVFLREDGIVKGGLVAKINNDTPVPHAIIEKIWVDDTVRGKGAGRIIMEAALKHFQDCGLRTVTLETNAYHAPGFYERMGFEIGLRLPKMIRTLDGKLHDNFQYRRSLDEGSSPTPPGAGAAAADSPR